MQRLPSELLDLPSYIRRKFGYNVWFTCSQFDDAVLYIGSSIEAKLYEPAPEGKDKVTIADILGGKLKTESAQEQVTRISRDDPRINAKPKVKVSSS